jgi:hypothetical protein
MKQIHRLFVLCLALLHILQAELHEYVKVGMDATQEFIIFRHSQNNAFDIKCNEI